MDTKRLPTHPGYVLKEELEARGISQVKFASCIGVSYTMVGNDVWIGQNVTLLPGVHIGDGTIIGANSVVAKDVPPYCIVAGNPSRVIRKRFDDELINYLLELKWWDWPIEKIEANFKALSSGDLSLIRKINK